MPQYQAATFINALSGFVVICGRSDVESPDFRAYAKCPTGILLSAAGSNTQPYNYPSTASRWRKLTVPIAFESRLRTSSWAQARILSEALLRNGGIVDWASVQICLQAGSIPFKPFGVSFTVYAAFGPIVLYS